MMIMTVVMMMLILMVMVMIMMMMNMMTKIIMAITRQIFKLGASDFA